MSDVIKMQVKNAQAVQNALNAFEKKIAKKIVRTGVRASWTPLLKRAKENARSKVGGDMGKLIARSLQLRAFKKQKRSQYGMLVRIKKGVDEFVVVSKSGQRNFIPAAIEYGHAFPYHGKGPGGGAPKDVAAISYLRSALDITLPKAPMIFRTHLVRAIREENMKK